MWKSWHDNVKESRYKWDDVIEIRKEVHYEDYTSHSTIAPE